MEVGIFDQTHNKLGEGPLWHPGRQELFWFDIESRILYRRAGDDQSQWNFDQFVSAAGWIDQETLLIATDNSLASFTITSGTSEVIAPLENENPLTRSNDGRADPYGGFWIGTMGIGHETAAGAIYRYYRGEVRQLFSDITVPNAICFSPDGGFAYFADSMRQQIMRQKLDPADGWPKGDPEVFVDLTGEKFGPDGAVVDALGNLWNARWGGYAVACYGPDGKLKQTLSLPTALITCPGFGGSDLSTLFVTSAWLDLSAEKRQQQPAAGQTFRFENAGKGQAEHQVIL
ncbi:MAG: SMP-30/gluconolactonase/LRE family protein [Alphaproteobacteria bacterium]|nr:SMP-30/gluconolactonase/LRE family protein [Alphaproteobacteria bacterium]MBT4019828.1 SMP-30/gluconolactonase/LRE family protein [Alphaproteobacteria bacterium]MBT4966177.1 SMP-30/gluconolactonase/LRE family protein [Alphaproteobacteria bacterium]MBT5158630.1 SMP-30/gluconolactonase/LRE family protein [Alphaproteobacteria bacterium]MBT5920041.1 SMP-30/gluconolactonase/LRE family protein [Alphaproteobacteria bacterium]